MRKIVNLVNKINEHSSIGDLKTVSDCKVELATELVEYIEAHFYEMTENNKYDLANILSFVPNEFYFILEDRLTSGFSARKIILLELYKYLPAQTKFRELMKTALNDGDAYVRATAVKVIGQMTDDKYIANIMQLLYDSDKRVVSNTLEALEELDFSSTKTVLLRYKNDSHNRVKATSLKLLWKAGHRDIMDPLKDMFSSNDEKMIASAFWVLSTIDFPMQKVLALAEKFAKVSSRLIRISVIKTLIKREPTLVDTFIKNNFSNSDILTALNELRYVS